MSQIFDKTFERTLDALVAKAEPGQSFEAWTFDDAKSRRETEERLKKKGICARIRAERGREMTVIGTGGLSTLFAQGTDVLQKIDTDLTIHGLVVIDRLNKGVTST